MTLAKTLYCNIMTGSQFQTAFILNQRNFNIERYSVKFIQYAILPMEVFQFHTSNFIRISYHYTPLIYSNNKSIELLSYLSSG